MQDLSKKGGGTLIVPKGIWFTGPIVFESNINMYLEKGALILFSPDKDSILWLKQYSKDWKPDAVNLLYQDVIGKYCNYR